MCGFAGMIDLGGLSGTREERLSVLDAMGRQLARRGPDDEQFYDDGLLSFVFRRLAIIDLEGGRQPLWNEDHTVLAAVNGEIYNHHELRDGLRQRHRFRSNSDCEVVVHLYEDRGEDFLDCLNGMFAILVWDLRKRRLLLARDRMGIKPLHYAQVGKALLFASELKALLVHPQCPREFDWTAIPLRSARANVVPSYIRDVHCLLGGQCIAFESSGAVSPRAYWSFADYLGRDDAVQDRTAPTTPFIDTYDELLSDSVRMRRMSDVEVGLFLSGGIDSSLIAVLAAEWLPNLHCFTVVAEPTVRIGDVEQADRITQQLGLTHHPVVFDLDHLLDDLDFKLADLEYITWVVETPRFSLEWVIKHELHRYAKTVVPGLKVMLLGQGADEFTGGYSRSSGSELSWDEYLSNVQQVGRGVRRAELQIPLQFTPLLADDYPLAPEGDGPLGYREEMLRRVYTLQRYNLWHEDRTSAAQGVEARVPFLDHRLVEFLASLPSQLHESLFQDKHIIRKVMERHLPEYPPGKLKVGFMTTGNDAMLVRTRMMIIHRIYPAFREKYLDRMGAIFSLEKMDALYHQIMTSRQITWGLLDLFFDCMAISIFESMCRNLVRDGPPPGQNPPSRLRAGTLPVQ